MKKIIQSYWKAKAIKGKVVPIWKQKNDDDRIGISPKRGKSRLTADLEKFRRGRREEREYGHEKSEGRVIITDQPLVIEGTKVFD